MYFSHIALLDERIKAADAHPDGNCKIWSDYMERTVQSFADVANEEEAMDVANCFKRHSDDGIIPDGFSFDRPSTIVDYCEYVLLQDPNEQTGILHHGPPNTTLKGFVLLREAFRKVGYTPITHHDYIQYMRDYISDTISDDGDAFDPKLFYQTVKDVNAFQQAVDLSKIKLLIQEYQ